MGWVIERFRQSRQRPFRFGNMEPKRITELFQISIGQSIKRPVLSKCDIIHIKHWLENESLAMINF